jgi:hypothetical protein
MNYRSTLVLIISLSGMLLPGCSKTDEVSIDTLAVPGKAVAADAAAATGTATQPAADEKKTPEVVEADKESDATSAYTPPFPERLELFQPPMRAQNTARRDDEHGEAVELKGFIYVDEPRVVLSIDGVVSSVPEGGEKYGVQVISIEPPTVVLQRGRDRWPATLE